MRVLVFGTFDCLHQGHLYFLRSAKTLADELVVGVARDAHVRQLKHKEPKQTEDERFNAVSQLSYVDKAVFCDEELGTFTILSSVQPDLIILGHDQEDLEQSILSWLKQASMHIEIKRIAELSFETCANCTCSHG